MMDKEIEQLSQEQAADLAALTAAAGDAPALPGQEAAPVVDPVESLGDEIAGIVLSVVTVISPALPSLKGIYTPETTKAAANSIAAVCAKRGWLGSGLMGEYAEEFTCAMILLPLAVTTHSAVKGDIAKLKEKAGEAKQVEAKAKPVEAVAGVAVVPDQPGGQGVTFGTVS